MRDATVTASRDTGYGVVDPAGSCTGDVTLVEGDVVGVGVAVPVPAELVVGVGVWLGCVGVTLDVGEWAGVGVCVGVRV